MIAAGDRCAAVVAAGASNSDALILGIAFGVLVHAITAAENLVAFVGAGAGNGDAGAALCANEMGGGGGGTPRPLAISRAIGVASGIIGIERRRITLFAERRCHDAVPAVENALAIRSTGHSALIPYHVGSARIRAVTDFTMIDATIAARFLPTYRAATISIGSIAVITFFWIQTPLGVDCTVTAEGCIRYGGPLPAIHPTVPIGADGAYPRFFDLIRLRNTSNYPAAIARPAMPWLHDPWQLIYADTANCGERGSRRCGTGWGCRRRAHAGCSGSGADVITGTGNEHAGGALTLGMGVTGNLVAAVVGAGTGDVLALIELVAFGVGRTSAAAAAAAAAAEDLVALIRTCAGNGNAGAALCANEMGGGGGGSGR